MKELSESDVKKQALYDFMSRSPISSVLNQTNYCFLIESEYEGFLGIESYLKIIDHVTENDWYWYDYLDKWCHKLNSEHELSFAGNCSLESVEFWNRVVPNVDVPYECHEPDPVEVRPTFVQSDGKIVTGRQIKEFDRIGLNTYFGQGLPFIFYKLS